MLNVRQQMAPTQTAAREAQRQTNGKVEGRIQAKVSSFQTDTCGITMIMLLNGGWILLLTVGVWFYSWTTWPEGIFYFADRWLLFFISWESKELLWCASQDLYIQQESHRDHTCCPLTSDLLCFHRNDASTQVCFLPAWLGETGPFLLRWCKKARRFFLYQEGWSVIQHHHHYSCLTWSLTLKLQTFFILQVFCAELQYCTHCIHHMTVIM